MRRFRHSPSLAIVTFELGRSALVDVPTIVLAAASAVLLLRFEVNSAWLVIGGALLGLGISLLPDGISLSR